MCWSINSITYNQDYCNHYKTYKKIAEKDVEVFKIGFKGENKFTPLFYRNFSYEANKANEQVKLYLDDSYFRECIIHEGYHSYSGECVYFYENWGGYGAWKIMPKSKEYESYELTSKRFINNNYIIGKFIIPKGIEYFENEDGEIVSSQLIWTGESKYIKDIGCDVSNATIKLKDIELCVGK